MQSQHESGTKSVWFSPVGVSVNSKFPAGTDGSDVLQAFTSGIKKNCLLHPFFFLTFRVRWVLSHRFTTLPLYTDGVLFLRIKPIIAVSSEDVMTQLSGFCSRYSNRTGEPALTVPGRVQDVDLFSKSKDFHIYKLFSYKYCGTSGTKSSNIYVTFLFYIT